MLETQKATKRRRSDSEFAWHSIFDGSVILDTGCGTDPLVWPEAKVVIPFDLPDGGGDRIDRFFPGFRVDVIHASNVLEHAQSPEVMLESWLKLLKYGGHIVATVPDWTLYEKRIWPSKWNAGHRSTWSLNTPGDPHRPGENRIHVTLPDWLAQFGCEILRCKIISTNYNQELGPEVDQTFDANNGVECCIEFVLKKP
jgi:hypothetical protein